MDIINCLTGIECEAFEVGLACWGVSYARHCWGWGMPELLNEALVTTAGTGK